MPKPTISEAAADLAWLVERIKWNVENVSDCPKSLIKTLNDVLPHMTEAINQYEAAIKVEK